MLAKILGDSLKMYIKEMTVDRSAVETVEGALNVVRAAEAEWAEIPVPALDGKTPAQALAELSDPEAWREFLVGWLERADREWLPYPVRQALLQRAAGDLAPMLIDLAGQDGPLGALAMRLLGEARVESAVPALLSLMERLDPVTPGADAAVEALREIGEPARAGLYDLCERYGNDVDSDPYCSAIEVLVGLPQDDRTWRYLRRALEQSERLIGVYGAIAGDYRDKRAVFFLNTILEEKHLDREDQLIIQDSLEMCGGVLTPKAEMRLRPRPRVDVPAGKVGRNDPCPCGSGKKYKKCCGQ